MGLGKSQTQTGVVHQSHSKIKIGSILAALVASIAIFTVMMQMEKKMLTDYEKGKIYVTICKIPKGQKITSDNWSTYLKEAWMDQELIPETALTTVEEIEEMVPKAELDQGVILTTGMFRTKENMITGMKDPVIAGLKAEDLFQVAGGILRAGDKIHIYSVDEETKETILKWSNVYVQEVFDQTGNVITVGEESSGSPAQRVNVYMDKSQVEEFYTGLSNGSLRAVKVNE